MSGIFDTAIAAVLAHEGGYVCDPADPGGATKFGISQRAYPRLDIAALTLEQAKAIYLTDYWLRHRLNQLPPAIAPKLLDTAVLIGPGTAIRMLQRALGAIPDPAGPRPCVVDGVIGPGTLQASSAADPAALLAEYRRLLLEHFDKIAAADPAAKTFLGGWKTRALA